MSYLLLHKNKNKDDIRKSEKQLTWNFIKICI